MITMRMAYPQNSSVRTKPSRHWPQRMQETHCRRVTPTTAEIPGCRAEPTSSDCPIPPPPKATPPPFPRPCHSPSWLASRRAPLAPEPARDAPPQVPRRAEGEVPRLPPLPGHEASRLPNDVLPAPSPPLFDARSARGGTTTTTSRKAGAIIQAHCPAAPAPAGAGRRHAAAGSPPPAPPGPWAIPKSHRLPGAVPGQ